MLTNDKFCWLKSTTLLLNFPRSFIVLSSLAVESLTYTVIQRPLVEYREEEDEERLRPRGKGASCGRNRRRWLGCWLYCNQGMSVNPSILSPTESIINKLKEFYFAPLFLIPLAPSWIIILVIIRLQKNKKINK